MLLDPNTTHVLVRQDVRCPPLHPSYKGPYNHPSRRAEKHFVLDYLTRSNRISMDRLKPAYLSFANLNSQLMDPVTDSQSHSQIPDLECSSLTPQADYSITQGPSDAPHMTLLSQPSHSRYLIRGRRIQIPSRLRDFCLV